MGFRARPSTHRISLAPTNRARCRKCRRLLAKGQPRIATTAYVMPGRATVFIRCAPECIDSNFATAALSVYKTAERVPIDPAVPCGVAEAVRAALAAAQ